MWIIQELKIGLNSIHLFEDSVAIEELDPGSKSTFARVYPLSRDEANRLSVAFRLAAKRLEEIGKGLE